MPATEWLAPRRYLRTTLQTALADVAASFTDRRETLAALDPRPEPAPDLDRSRDEELWIDYVADTGDGFDHTYPVAWALAQDELMVEGCTEPLPAGRLLIFGGDQVYPVASDDSYRDRFTGVFRAALPWRDAGAVRDAVAIPGNHDWYDGLGAFAHLLPAEVGGSLADAPAPQLFRGGAPAPLVAVGCRHRPGRPRRPGPARLLRCPRGACRARRGRRRRHREVGDRDGQAELVGCRRDGAARGAHRPRARPLRDRRGGTPRHPGRRGDRR